MKRQLIAIVLLLPLWVGCGHLPKTDIKLTKFEAGQSQNIKPDSNFKIENIEIFEGAYPEGIVKDEDLIKVLKEEGVYREGLVKDKDLFRIANASVLKEFENKIVTLGKVDINLVQGEETSPLIWINNYLYVNNRDISRLNKYCKAMNFQSYAPVFPFLITIPNFLGPWNYPCWFLKDHSSRKQKDIDYRTETLKYELRNAVLKMGGNAVIDFQVGRKSLDNGSFFSGIGTIDSPAWNATGLVVIITK